jgi:hypothetical protein
MSTKTNNRPFAALEQNRSTFPKNAPPFHQGGYTFQQSGYTLCRSEVTFLGEMQENHVKKGAF